MSNLLARIGHLGGPERNSILRVLLEAEDGASASSRSTQGVLQRQLESPAASTTTTPPSAAASVEAAADPAAYLDAVRRESPAVGTAGRRWDYRRFPRAPRGARWRPGDPIDMPGRDGYPTFDTARGRYWSNRAHFGPRGAQGRDRAASAGLAGPHPAALRRRPCGHPRFGQSPAGAEPARPDHGAGAQRRAAAHPQLAAEAGLRGRRGAPPDRGLQPRSLPRGGAFRACLLRRRGVGFRDAARRRDRPTLERNAGGRPAADTAPDRHERRCDSGDRAAGAQPQLRLHRQSGRAVDPRRARRRDPRAQPHRSRRSADPAARLDRRNTATRRGRDAATDGRDSCAASARRWGNPAADGTPPPTGGTPPPTGGNLRSLRPPVGEPRRLREAERRRLAAGARRHRPRPHRRRLSRCRRT